MTFPAALPEPSHTPLRGGPTVRWGVLAPGRIAADWVAALHTHTDQRVHAVASRSPDKARAFAAAHGIPRVHDDYAALVADPDVDVVYIAAPHTEHRSLALLAISAGTNVLIEKPIAVTAAEAREIAHAAREAGVFAMEAMWSRFLPQSTIIARLLADGALGEVRSAAADFGAVFGFDPADRVWNPALGGGALLDIGVYSLWFTHLALGAPTRVIASGHLAPTGVEDEAALLLEYASGARATATASMLARTPTIGAISGTEARIEVAPLFLSASGFRLVTADDERELRWRDESGLTWRHGLCYQATAVAAHISAGSTEAPEHPLTTSIALLEVIDEARRQLGVA